MFRWAEVLYWLTFPWRITLGATATFGWTCIRDQQTFTRVYTVVRKEGFSLSRTNPPSVIRPCMSYTYVVRLRQVTSAPKLVKYIEVLGPWLYICVFAASVVYSLPPAVFVCVSVSQLCEWVCWTIEEQCKVMIPFPPSPQSHRLQLCCCLPEGVFSPC